MSDWEGYHTDRGQRMDTGHHGDQTHQSVGNDSSGAHAGNVVGTEMNAGEHWALAEL